MEGLCALILAVLNKLIFGLIFFGGPAAGAFYLCYAKGLLPFKMPTEGDALKSLIGCAVAILIMLLIRKNFQRLVTAFLGGFLLNFGIKALWDYPALLPAYADYLNYGVLALFTLIGFIYQYRRRRRY